MKAKLLVLGGSDRPPAVVRERDRWPQRPDAQLLMSLDMSSRSGTCERRWKSKVTPILNACGDVLALSVLVAVHLWALGITSQRSTGDLDKLGAEDTRHHRRHDKTDITTSKDDATAGRNNQFNTQTRDASRRIGRHHTMIA
jgi:hypothetical protein